MKFLLDTCFWGGAVRTLEDAGHDVVWAGKWLEDPGDEEILSRAHEEGRILVTLDKDFGEMAIIRENPHSGIIRLVNLSAGQHGTVFSVLSEITGRSYNPVQLSPRSPDV